MAQQSNEHLTIADLSAYIDEELTPEESTLCRAHIASCQLCQAALADLRLTSALLSSMPQVAIPRSFTLPTNVVALPATPALENRRSGRVPGMTSRVWQRSLRVVSTLAALVGLLFVLAGALSALPHGGGMSSIAVTASSSSGNASQARPLNPTPTGTLLQNMSPTARSTRAATALTTPIPASTPTSSTNSGQIRQKPGQPSLPQSAPELPAVLDPGQPAGRLTIGAALLLLGILGIVAARLSERMARRERYI